MARRRLPPPAPVLQARVLAACPLTRDERFGCPGGGIFGLLQLSPRAATARSRPNQNGSGPKSIWLRNPSQFRAPLVASRAADHPQPAGRRHQRLFPGAHVLARGGRPDRRALRARPCQAHGLAARRGPLVFSRTSLEGRYGPRPTDSAGSRDRRTGRAAGTKGLRRRPPGWRPDRAEHRFGNGRWSRNRGRSCR